MIFVRPYKPQDYEQVVALYRQSDLYGGQFDPDRDSAERLKAVTENFPQAILVAENDGKICGTVSLIEDARTAWLFRFAASEDAAKPLYESAASVLKGRGHLQVLVYAPASNSALNARYASLGFDKGNDYACFYKLF